MKVRNNKCITITTTRFDYWYKWLISVASCNVQCWYWMSVIIRNILRLITIILFLWAYCSIKYHKDFMKAIIQSYLYVRLNPTPMSSTLFDYRLKFLINRSIFKDSLSKRPSWQRRPLVVKIRTIVRKYHTIGFDGNFAKIIGH